MTDLNKNFLIKSAKATLSGRDEINERLDNILMSIKGTHFFNRGFGFINRVLFRDLSQDSADDLMAMILAVLDDAMPEVVVDRLKSQCIPYHDQGYYLIQLYYTIMTTGTQSTYQNTMEVTNG